MVNRNAKNGRQHESNAVSQVEAYSHLLCELQPQSGQLDRYPHDFVITDSIGNAKTYEHKYRGSGFKNIFDWLTGATSKRAIEPPDVLVCQMPRRGRLVVQRWHDYLARESRLSFLEAFHKDHSE